MKKYLLIAAAVASVSMANAQSAMDGYMISQPDMKGTARFMSMGGAFGALGGDLTTLSYNPAGIGVYRSSELGATINFDIQSTTTQCGNYSLKDNQFKFPFNNAGYVGTVRLPGLLRNFNWGFTYNKAASFNRRYAGNIAGLHNSMSNYIAGICNADGVTVGDLESTKTYDPYNPTDGGYVSPWLAILGYDSYLINPSTNLDGSTNWSGLYGNGTYGSGYFNGVIKGGVDEYNIAFGGNLGDVVFWGMDFGITDLNMTAETLYGEKLDDAYVTDGGTGTVKTYADWDLYNYYNVNGTGFNYKLGVIIKPIQELRLGIAFHTPTWYNITESFYADTSYDMGGGNPNFDRDPYNNHRRYGTGVTNNGAQTNNGYYGSNSYNFHTPWRVMASAAGVIGGKFIISADYEWKNYQGMSFGDQYNNNFWGGPSTDSYYETNQDIDRYYQQSNTWRFGAEYRVTPNFSLRAGYSNVSSPVEKSVRDSNEVIYTAGTRPEYTFDDDIDYVTCGLGYRYQNFYVDAAYVWKHRTSQWNAYTPDPENPAMDGPEGKIISTNNQIVLSMGFKF